MSNDDFYIGWQDEAPISFVKTRRWFFLLASAALLVFAVLFAYAERGFIDSYFAYGDLTEVEGQLRMQPVPMLVVDREGEASTIPLVGFGKFGAKKALQHLVDKKLEGSIVTVRGTHFGYQDREWMELTEGAESIISVSSTKRPLSEKVTLGRVEISGEIVDPKCFFGVMNPATKAVHRSCAIRCISGGVPAILAIRRNGVFVDYFFLLDQDGKPVGKEVLPWVGIPVTVSGQASQVEDWKMLEFNPESTEISLLGDQSFICAR